MRKTLLLCFVLFLPVLMLGQEKSKDDHGNHYGRKTTVTTTNKNVATSTSSAVANPVQTNNAVTTSEGGEATAYGGNAAATQTQTAQGGQANNAGNSQSTSFHQVRQAPLAYAPEAYPSAPCRVAGSAGVSSPIGGVALGGSKQDDECDKRETARAFFLVGAREAGLKVLCSTKAAKEAMGADCLKISSKPPEAAKE